MATRPMPKRGARAATNKATRKSEFKTCPGCPSPATCKARGMCAKKAMLKKAN